MATNSLHTSSLHVGAPGTIATRSASAGRVSASSTPPLGWFPIPHWCQIHWAGIGAKFTKSENRALKAMGQHSSLAYPSIRTPRIFLFGDLARAFRCQIVGCVCPNWRLLREVGKFNWAPSPQWADHRTGSLTTVTIRRAPRRLPRATRTWDSRGDRLNVVDLFSLQQGPSKGSTAAESLQMTKSNTSKPFGIFSIVGPESFIKKICSGVGERRGAGMTAEAVRLPPTYLLSQHAALVPALCVVVSSLDDPLSPPSVQESATNTLSPFRQQQLHP